MITLYICYTSRYTYAMQQKSFRLTEEDIKELDRCKSSLAASSYIEVIRRLIRIHNQQPISPAYDKKTDSEWGESVPELIARREKEFPIINMDDGITLIKDEQ